MVGWGWGLGFYSRSVAQKPPPLSRRLAPSQLYLGDGICPRKGKIFVQTPEKEEEVEGEERESPGHSSEICLHHPECSSGLVL